MAWGPSRFGSEVSMGGAIAERGVSPDFASGRHRLVRNVCDLIFVVRPRAAEFDQ